MVNSLDLGGFLNCGKHAWNQLNSPIQNSFWVVTSILQGDDSISLLAVGVEVAKPDL